MRARQANKAPAIVDVAPGETGEEAQAKASGPCLESPGKSAGILVASLSDGELLDVAASAEKYLSDYPNGKHSAVIRKDMLTVSAELDRRAPQENS